MDTVNYYDPDKLYYLIPESSDESGISYYKYTAYFGGITLTRTTDSGYISGKKIFRNVLPVSSISVGDTIYFDFTTDNSITSLDFNDNTIEHHSVKTENGYYRIFGLYTITAYDLTGKNGGRLYDYDKTRFLDINAHNNEFNLISTIFVSNPTIHADNFNDQLVIPNKTITFYKIEAVDMSGKISKPTYVVINNQ